MITNLNQIYNGDCFDLIKLIPEKSIHCIICDPPYGITEAKWDCSFDLNMIWNLYKKILKSNGSVVLFSNQPFTSDLILSNREMFKYELVWIKSRPSGHLNAKSRPMRGHENILVFSEGAATSTSLTMTYNPQGLIKCNVTRKNFDTETTGSRKSRRDGDTYIQNNTGYPQSVLKFKCVDGTIHPTEKPVDLIEYLIKTYSNEGDLILDNFSGSGTTAIACINSNRNYICIEKNEKYYNDSIERVKSHTIYHGHGFW